MKWVNCILPLRPSKSGGEGWGLRGQPTAALGPKKYTGLPALGLKMYQGQPALNYRLVTRADIPGYKNGPRAGCPEVICCTQGCQPWSHLLYSGLPALGPRMDWGLAALGPFLDQGLPALGHLLYPGLTALGPKMDLGLAALGTKMYSGLPAPGTRGHAEFGVVLRLQICYNIELNKIKT